MKTDMHNLTDVRVYPDSSEEAEYDKMQLHAKSAPRRPLSPYIFFS